MGNGDSLPQYNLGDKLVTTGEKITHIFGQTTRAGVFSVRGQIRWEYYADTTIPENVHVAISIFEELWYRIAAQNAVYQVALLRR